MIGAAAGLLVFTGVWHCLEWAMHGRNRDTARLIPAGLIYVVLGCCLATATFMPWALWISLGAVGAGTVAALTIKNTADVPKWVTWSFIIIDLFIIAALLMALIG